MIRYPMIFLIVVAHVLPGAGFVEHPSLSSFITSFVTNGLIPLGLSLLTCISGFLLFHKSLHLDVSLLFRKRFSSLVMPLLIWNIPLVLALYIVQARGIVAYDFAPGKTMYPFDLMTWLNGILALTDFPINFPLHFLRDLFVISLMSPLMGVIIRRFPYFGLVAIIVIFSQNFDGFLVRSNALAISFYIGGMACILDWDLKKLDRYVVLILALLVTACTLIVFFDTGRPFWLRVVAPIFVWPIFSVLLGTRVGTWLQAHSRASIFLFMLHGLVILALRAFFPNLHSGDHAFFFWFITPIFVAVVCQIVYMAFVGFAPNLLNILMGGRTVKPKTEV